MDGEAGEYILQGTHGGGNGGHFFLGLLRTALTVLVQIVPILLQRLLCVFQQSYYVFRWCFVLLVREGRWVQHW